MQRFVILALMFAIVGCGGRNTPNNSAGNKGTGTEAEKAEELRQLIVEADAVWESGDKPTAAEMYAEIMRNWPLDNVPKLREMVQRGEEFDSTEENAKSMAAQQNRPAIGRIYERLIDFSVEQGNLDLARQLAQQAGKDRFNTLSPTTPQGKQIVAAAKAERDAANRGGFAKLREQGVIGDSSKPSGTGEGTTEAEMLRLFELLVKLVKPGTTSQQVISILGQPHKIEKQDPELVRTSNMEIWTWFNKDDPKNDFIMLSIVNGRAKSGGTQGFDIATGFRNAP